MPDLRALLALGILGGASLWLGHRVFKRASDRFVETVRLARRFPEALVVLSGGTADLLPEGKLLSVAAYPPRLRPPISVRRRRPSRSCWV